MKAQVGDRVVVRGVTLDRPVRDGEVVEVHGSDGAPPYLVRWSADGHTSLFFPGSDAVVERTERPPRDAVAGDAGTEG